MRCYYVLVASTHNGFRMRPTKRSSQSRTKLPEEEDAAAATGDDGARGQGGLCALCGGGCAGLAEGTMRQAGARFGDSYIRKPLELAVLRLRR